MRFPGNKTATPAGLGFPNPSRCYEERAQGVRFWGYDRTFEISFFVGETALAGLGTQPVSGEAASLDAFDVNRDRICEVAGSVYARRPKGSNPNSYRLTDSDF